MFFSRSPLLQSIYQDNKLKLYFIYGLNIIQEIAYLLVPAAAGSLINSLITGQGWGILFFCAAYLGWQGVAMYRKIMDTKVFTRIYNEVSIKTIEHHKANGIETGKINARIELLKQVVSFFENDLPFLVSSLVAMFGAAGLLFFYNPRLLLVCIIIIIPSLIINHFFGKKMVQVTSLVNNEYEKQLDVIETGAMPQIKHYFQQVRLLNVRKSNLEAFNFGLLEIFVFIMILASLVIVVKTGELNYGNIVATYGYILRFAYSFDFIPHLTERLATMKDIQNRLEEVYE
jgi:ABC-type bacteriocin/lantibiotic exporter with double-glycine peptidase domain